jgi:LysR family malonate utilization transcriptional regulator
MKSGNMARVSESLDQSVVSVHRALHSLEESTRCALFKLDGRRLIPLQTAYTFAEYAERVVRECEEGLRKTREVAGLASPRLKIGSLYSLTISTIPQLLIKLKLRKSALDVDLTLGSNQLLLEQLRQGRLDAIIIALRSALEDRNCCRCRCSRTTSFSPRRSAHIMPDATHRPGGHAQRKFVALGDELYRRQLQ